jgi:hypothetical protein
MYSLKQPSLASTSRLIGHLQTAFKLPHASVPATAQDAGAAHVQQGSEAAHKGVQQLTMCNTRRAVFDKVSVLIDLQ